MRKLFHLAIGSTPQAAWPVIVLIRIHVGLIFILAAVRKFFEPEEMGPGRFEELGFAAPTFMSYWVGAWELIGGVLVLIGLLTRVGAVPLVVVMISAIWITKIDYFVEMPLTQALHGTRLDFAMLMSALFLMIAGGGRFAVDRLLENR